MRRDEKRYIDRVREAIKNKLPELVNNSSILSSPPGSSYVLKIPYLDVPHFRLAQPGSNGSGSGNGGNAGNGSGDPYIELQLSLDEVVDLIFSSLHLPQLPKTGITEDEQVKVEGITRDTHPQRIHIKRTIYEATKQGVWWPGVMRYRDVRVKAEPITSAVVIFARDSSGSMTEELRYIVRVASLWITLWLKKVYPKTKLHFVIHDEEALEVDEEMFFNGHKAGGTLVSSAWLKAEELFKSYDPTVWNRYMIYFSDGENMLEDNSELRKILARLVPQLELAVYGEVKYQYQSLLSLMSSHGVRASQLLRVEDVSKWISHIFSKELAR